MATQLEKEFYSWWYGEGGNSFNIKLFELIMKADLANRSKIRSIYPEHVNVYETHSL